VIHGFVLALFVALVVRAFVGTGVSGWAIGLIYIAYDTGLLLFTFWQSLVLRRREAVPVAAGRPSLAVVIAAHNEEAALPETIAALLAQSEPAEEIWIGDDGSTDGTAAVLGRLYGLRAAPGGVGAAGNLVAGGKGWKSKDFEPGDPVFDHSVNGDGGCRYDPGTRGFGGDARRVCAAGAGGGDGGFDAGLRAGGGGAGAGILPNL
jgi:hypothetical protein